MGQAERALRELGAALARAQDAEREAAPAADGAARLVAAFEPRSRRPAIGVWALSLAAAAVLVLLVWWPRALRFEVEGRGAGQAEAAIEAQAQPLPLRFSDGTELALAPEARARVLELHDDGARVVLEKGTLAAQVVHRGASRWSVLAGPYEVRVTGTRFDVSWSPASASFELLLREGSVQVLGPSLGEGRVLRGGESLRLGPRAAPHPQQLPPEAPVVPLSPDASVVSVSPGPAVQAPPESGVAARPPQARPREVRDDLSETWRTLRRLSREGRHAEVLRLARGRGVAPLSEQATAADLMLLADAARLSGEASLARDVLLVLRARFPADNRAATAGFLLGRIAFERAEYREATRWFALYLEEASAGPLAGEALLRLAQGRAELGDAEGSRQAAQRYLELYPSGPLVEQARRLAD